MEPGDLRESPAGSGESEPGDWREIIPGGVDDDDDDEVKAAETNEASEETVFKETCGEEDSGETLKDEGEQPHSPYEEELDPRIQV